MPGSQAAAWKSIRELGKKIGEASFIWDMGSASVIWDVWLLCNCTGLSEKEDVAQSSVRTSIIREASEALAGSEASAGALCLFQDHTSRKIQTNWKK